MTAEAKRWRIAVGAFALVVVAVAGWAAGAAGAITCHEDVGSSDQAPQLCSTVGTGTALWLPAPLGAAAVLVLLLRPRSRLFLLGLGAVLAAEIALVAMWALVSHGTIHY
jgi:hypothetical protein